MEGSDRESFVGGFDRILSSEKHFHKVMSISEDHLLHHQHSLDGLVGVT
jgi:hypothetical protein